MQSFESSFSTPIAPRGNSQPRMILLQKIDTIRQYLIDGKSIKNQLIDLKENFNIQIQPQNYRDFLNHYLHNEYKTFVKTNHLLSIKIEICLAIETKKNNSEQFNYLKEKKKLGTQYKENFITENDYNLFLEKWGNKLKEWWEENKEFLLSIRENRNTKKTSIKKYKQKEEAEAKELQEKIKPEKATKEVGKTSKKEKNIATNDPSEAQLNLENKISSDGRFKPWKPENFKESIGETNEVLFREDITEEYLLTDVVRAPGMHNVIDELRQFAVAHEDIELYERFKEDGYFQKGDLIYIQHKKKEHYTLYRLWDNFELVKLREGIWAYAQIFGRYFEVARGNFEMIKFLNDMYGHVIMAMKATPHESVKEKLREMGVVV